MLHKYSALIYDWDGCLLDSLPTWIKAYKSTLNNADIDRSSQDITKVIGNHDALEALGHPYPEKGKIEFQRKLNELIPGAKLYPGVIETLRNITEKNIKIFLATSSHKKTYELSTASNAVNTFLEYSVFADDVSQYKPNPEPLDTIINKFNIPRSKILMIGESDKDILAAQNAGVDSLWFAHPSNETVHDFSYLRSLKPTWSIENHADIIKV